MLHDGRLGTNLIEAVDAVDDMKDLTLKQRDYQSFTFYDDVIGKELPKDLTMNARQTEMKQDYAHRV